ncbi:MAG: phage holin family protein [Clostridia bacterium]|nr:phage holin family protein [Clostridia bacterium]
MSWNNDDRGGLPGWLVKWLINALALLIVSFIPYGHGRLVEIDGAGAALIAAMVLGIVNTFIRPILMFFSIPMQLLTFGMFTFVVNAAMLLLASWLMGSSFNVPGFWAAVLASILLSLTGGALNSIIRGDRH